MLKSYILWVMAELAPYIDLTLGSQGLLGALATAIELAFKFERFVLYFLAEPAMMVNLAEFLD